MLSITLGILKIIGVILLALFGLVLLALCLLLFVPLRYKVKAAAHGLKIEAEAYASWLFKLVRMKYIRNAGEVDLRVYIFWFYKIRLDKKKDNNIKVKIPENINESAQNKEGKLFENTYEPDQKKDGKPPGSANTPDQKKDGKPPENSNEPAQGKEGVFSRIKDMTSQINYYRDYPNRNEIISAAWGLLKKLRKKIKPKKLRLSGEVGLGLPHHTAYLFALAGALCLHVYGIRPNFDEQTLNLRLYVRGKISLWSILWLLFRFAIKRSIRPIIKKIIKKR